MVIVYANNQSLSENIPAEVDKFIKQNNFGLTTGNLILDENYAMVLINEFPAKGSAMQFLSRIETGLVLSESYKGEKFYYLVISEDNFDIFYQTKDLNAYLNFFETHY